MTHDIAGAARNARNAAGAACCSWLAAAGGRTGPERKTSPTSRCRSSATPSARTAQPNVIAQRLARRLARLPRLPHQRPGGVLRSNWKTRIEFGGTRAPPAAPGPHVPRDACTIWKAQPACATVRRAVRAQFTEPPSRPLPETGCPPHPSPPPARQRTIPQAPLLNAAATGALRSRSPVQGQSALGQSGHRRPRSSNSAGVYLVEAVHTRPPRQHHPHRLRSRHDHQDRRQGPRGKPGRQSDRNTGQPVAAARRSRSLARDRSVWERLLTIRRWHRGDRPARDPESPHRLTSAWWPARARISPSMP
jgi:hypothetical protein